MNEEIILKAKNILINSLIFEKEEIQWAKDTILIFGNFDDIDFILK
jgi:hypothetical protein